MRKILFLLPLLFVADACNTGAKPIDPSDGYVYPPPLSESKFSDTKEVAFNCVPLYTVVV